MLYRGIRGVHQSFLQEFRESHLSMIPALFMAMLKLSLGCLGVQIWMRSFGKAGQSPPELNTTYTSPVLFINRHCTACQTESLLRYTMSPSESFLLWRMSVSCQVADFARLPRDDSWSTALPKKTVALPCLSQYDTCWNLMKFVEALRFSGEWQRRL